MDIESPRFGRFKLLVLGPERQLTANRAVPCQDIPLPSAIGLLQPNNGTQIQGERGSADHGSPPRLAIPAPTAGYLSGCEDGGIDTETGC
jgi:hypothetical protein